MIRMNGILLIVIGLLTTGTGVMLFIKSSKTQMVMPDQKTDIIKADSVIVGSESDEVAVVDKTEANVKAGLEFEKYVVLKFNEKHFTLKNWAGDKYVEGRYAESTTQPDLQLELRLKGKIYPLAVECKWRSKSSSKFVRFADDDQLVRYKAFEKKNKIPSFIVLGVGGTPASPEVVYVIPVKVFNKPNQHLENLDQYKRLSDKDFFYNAKTQILN